MSNSDLTNAEKIINGWTPEKRTRQEARYFERGENDPTPEEIVERAAALRTLWSDEEERARRMTGRYEPANLAVVPDPAATYRRVYSE